MDPFWNVDAIKTCGCSEYNLIRSISSAKGISALGNLDSIVWRMMSFMLIKIPARSIGVISCRLKAAICTITTQVKHADDVRWHGLWWCVGEPAKVFEPVLVRVQRRSEGAVENIRVVCALVLWLAFLVYSDLLKAEHSQSARPGPIERRPSDVDHFTSQ
ncbi:unnamed protein product [Toxocara canis]|uniref:Transmembrane protein n=1 Tax=Toxocara canis TaxID=6265 RepID=A0A183VE80_TOXCA|nr:unnamed protein product [Toxocara canis]